MIDLPPNMRPKRLRSGDTAYYWEVPTKDRAAGCKLANEALGRDLSAAIEKAQRLNALLSATRRGESDPASPGSVKWLGRWFLKHPKVTRLSTGTQADYADVIDLICATRTKAGTWGDLPAHAIMPRHADKLYHRLQWVEETDGDGKPVLGEDGQPIRRRRLRMANLCMQVARRMWRLAGRADHVDATINPFAKMDLESTDGEGAATPATWTELSAFVAKADELGHRSIGTAALIAWHWLQREVDVIGRLSWSHYEPGRTARIRHNKTRRLVTLPLIDGDGLLFADLETRLDHTPRHGPLIVMRDDAGREGVYRPWRADTFRHEVRAIADAAGLAHLSFASFRKGGLTEMGDAEATDQEMMAASGHQTREMLTVYVQRTPAQAARAARKRHLWRDLAGTKPAQSSERQGGGGSE